MDTQTLEDEIRVLAEDSLDKFMSRMPEQYEGESIKVSIAEDQFFSNGFQVIVELSIRAYMNLYSARASFNITQTELDNNLLQNVVDRSIRQGIEAIAESNSETISVLNGEVKIFDRKDSVTAECGFCKSEHTIRKKYVNITVGSGAPAENNDCENMELLKHYAIGKLLHEKCEYPCPLKREYMSIE